MIAFAHSNIKCVKRHSKVLLYQSIVLAKGNGVIEYTQESGRGICLGSQVETSRRQTPSEAGSKTQQDSGKLALKSGKVIRHAKHSSLVDAKSLLNNSKNTNKVLKKAGSNTSSKKQFKGTYASAASSRIQSPQSSMYKGTSSAETKRWQVVGVASARGLFSPCAARPEGDKATRTAIAKFIQAKRALQTSIGKKTQEQKLKEMLNGIKKEALNSIAEQDKKVEMKKGSVKLTSSRLQENAYKKKVSIASPVQRKIQGTPGRCQRSSPDISFKQAEKLKKPKAEQTALTRIIRSQPTSPDSSVYRPKRKASTGLSKIEQAKSDLIQWLLDCNSCAKRRPQEAQGVSQDQPGLLHRRTSAGTGRVRQGEPVHSQAQWQTGGRQVPVETAFEEQG
eukprot:TRINITY_DN10528_c0_g1_i15.p1 TRINITY_DN10528_c0_g1~~TRINITY_DN10528_c0_g1_i15.p1  ORF type:complete len:431 (-),score=84.77 TRINITY_DN10528_c0_g1_i15:1395-2573(-)